MPQTLFAFESETARAALTALYLLGYGIVLYSTFLIDHFDLFGLRQVFLRAMGRAYTEKRFATPTLYRLIRHPLYVGWIITFWADADLQRRAPAVRGGDDRRTSWSRSRSRSATSPRSSASRTGAGARARPRSCRASAARRLALEERRRRGALMRAPPTRRGAELERFEQQDARRAERRRARAHDVDRPPHGAVRRHEPDAAGDERREIAAEAGLDERYVREWLGAMVTGGVVEYEPGDATYALPPRARRAAHARGAARQPGRDAASGSPCSARSRTRSSSASSAAAACRTRRTRASTRVMAEESDQTVVAALVEQRRCRSCRGLREALARGIDVLDVGCGSGRALNRLAAAFPRSRFTGYDISAEAIEAARARGARARRSRTCASRSATPPSSGARPSFDLRHRVRRDPRPGPTRPGAARDRAQRCGRTACSCMQDIAGDQPPARGRRASRSRPSSTRLVPALHDRLARRGRHGPRRDVGRRARAAHAGARPASAGSSVRELPHDRSTCTSSRASDRRAARCSS